MNKHEFAGKMKELFPDGSDKAISKLITYAHELEASETYSKDDFFGESYVAYNLAAHKFGVDAAMQVLKVCEESCFNPWEIIDATRLVAEGVSPDKLMDKAVEGTLNFVPRESDEMEAGLEALKIGTLKIPKPNEKPSFGEESFMENNNTSTVINGELGIGDTVVSFNSSEYSYLAGIVRSIDKLGSPEHDTGNTNDDVHVDFTTLEYSPRRVSEIEGDFQKVYGDKRDFDELPLDDVIMSPGMLIRANNIDLTNRAEMDAILDSDEGATAFCNRVLLAHGLNLDGLNAATFSDNVQALMNEFYDEWQKEENKGKSKWDVLENYSEAHQIAVAFGNFNYQVENGGLHQWIYNGYFHDDAEKLTEYLESGVGLDERCQKILDTIYKLDQSARDTDCDRDGYYIEPDDEDSESQFIGDMIDCDGFDTWYYEHCGQDDWWKTVCGVIEEVTGHDFAHVQQVGEDECVSSPQLDATPSQAAGIEKSVEQVAPSLTPAQKSLNEPDAFDSQDVAVLRERVIERIDSNLADYFDTLRSLDGKAIVEKSSEIALMTEAHLYLSETYGFHLSDAQYLLQFKNPLEVVADAFEAEGFDNHRSNAMWKVLDRQDALQGNYELVSDNIAGDEPINSDTPKGYVIAVTDDGDSYVPGITHIERDALHDRLDENYADYKAETLRLGKSEIYDSMAEIATVQQAYEYFRNEHAFTAEQAEFLLKLQNPLELLSDRLPLGIEDKNHAAEYIFSEGNQEWVLGGGSYELASDDPETPPTTVSTQEKGTRAVGIGSGEKPSVIDEIRQSQKEVRERPTIPKEQPSPEKVARKKFDPDL